MKEVWDENLCTEYGPLGILLLCLFLLPCWASQSDVVEPLPRLALSLQRGSRAWPWAVVVDLDMALTLGLPTQVGPMHFPTLILFGKCSVRRYTGLHRYSYVSMVGHHPGLAQGLSLSRG